MRILMLWPLGLEEKASLMRGLHYSDLQRIFLAPRKWRLLFCLPCYTSETVPTVGHQQNTVLRRSFPWPQGNVIGFRVSTG